jgi:DNA-binding PadR family transcriptional regulator
VGPGDVVKQDGTAGGTNEQLTTDRYRYSFIPMPSAGQPFLDAKAFHILVAVAAGPSHGYAIRQEVEARTDGVVRLWPATLYGQLAALAADGLIQESPAPAGDDPRRRYYTITPAGRRLLSAEAARLDSLARLARARLGRRTT